MIPKTENGFPTRVHLDLYKQTLNLRLAVIECEERVSNGTDIAVVLSGKLQGLGVLPSESDQTACNADYDTFNLIASSGYRLENWNWNEWHVG